MSKERQKEREGKKGALNVGSGALEVGFHF